MAFRRPRTFMIRLDTCLPNIEYLDLRVSGWKTTLYFTKPLNIYWHGKRIDKIRVPRIEISCHIVNMRGLSIAYTVAEHAHSEIGIKDNVHLLGVIPRRLPSNTVLNALLLFNDDAVFFGNPSRQSPATSRASLLFVL